MIELKHARLLRGMTQIQLRKKSSVHNTTISYLERGLVKPRPDQIEKIEAALDMRGLIEWEEWN